MKLPAHFYQRDDTLNIARELLGKYLFSNVGGLLCGGIIVETEAYLGPEDRGSHSFNNRRTERNEMMYASGGVVYMYICYGIHHMLNVVTGPANSSHAILIRAVEPVTGLDVMRERRNIYNDDTRLCRGPGALASALGLTKQHNGVELQSNEIWIEDRGNDLRGEQIAAGPRIGMNFDGEYRDIPWRFFIRGNRFVSRMPRKKTSF